MSYKILITSPGFAGSNPEPIALLQAQGWELEFNKTGTILEQEELKKRIADAKGIILGTEPFGRNIIDAATKLKAIARYGVGLDNIDLEYARARGIQVRNAAGANSAAVADTAFALMLAVSKKVLLLDKQVRQGDWTETLTYEINHKVLGLIGFGNIGAQAAKRAKGFEMKVIAYDTCQNTELAKQHNTSFVDSMDEIFAQSDIISLHIPHLPQTHHIISTREFAMMKSEAILVNTARGGIVDEEALYAALKNNSIRGAGFDVFEEEPLPITSKLLKLENIVLSPHGAADTFESIYNVSMACAKNMVSMLAE